MAGVLYGKVLPALNLPPPPCLVFPFPLQPTVSCWLRLTPENVKILNSKKKVISVFTKTSVDYCAPV